MRIYLDNAATTCIEPVVARVMLPFLEGNYGNPSSVHSFGRESRAVIEKARKQISGLIGAQPSEIYFTSGGTEADNMAITGTVRACGIRTVISSPLEHHAVLHTLENLEKTGEIELRLLECDQEGKLNFDQLRQWLDENPHSLVSLMEANNEIGNLYPVEELAAEVKDRGGFFHSDTVQTIGKMHHNFSSGNIDFLIASGHKFHGPKGVGFIAISSRLKIPPFIFGGSQERNMRGGTENLMGIAGMAEALDISLKGLQETQVHMLKLKEILISRLKNDIPDVRFNGLSGDTEKSVNNILSVSLPPSDHSEMLLANLDIRGIAASGGSACTSGSETGSHVLRAMCADMSRPAVRFSFSKFNTPQEIHRVADELCSLYPVKAILHNSSAEENSRQNGILL